MSEIKKIEVCLRMFLTTTTMRIIATESGDIALVGVSPLKHCWYNFKLFILSVPKNKSNCGYFIYNSFTISNKIPFRDTA